MTRSTNMEHVEVLRHMKETIKAIAPSEVAALDAAIASLSAPLPPAEAQPDHCTDHQRHVWGCRPCEEAAGKFNETAEAQPCGCGEAACTVPWEPGCGLGKSEQHAEAQAQGGGEDREPDDGKVICPACCHQFRAIPVQVQRDMIAAGFEPPFTAPPSAPVGVEGYLVERLHGDGYGPARSIVDAAVYDPTNNAFWSGPESQARHRVTPLVPAPAQQPAADGGFTAADMMDARQEGRKEARFSCDTPPGRCA